MIGWELLAKLVVGSETTSRSELITAIELMKSNPSGPP